MSNLTNVALMLISKPSPNSASHQKSLTKAITSPFDVAKTQQSEVHVTPLDNMG